MRTPRYLDRMRIILAYNYFQVVLAEVKGMNQASAIFGSTKLRAGTRLGSWEVDKMDLVFRPKKEELRIWWTMK